MPPANQSYLLSTHSDGKSKLTKLKSWLAKSGVEILHPKEWEHLRFSCPEGIGLIYFNRRGGLSWNGLATIAWEDFTEGVAFRYGAVGKRRMEKKERDQLVPTLWQRDGKTCVICGKPMAREDVSIEHLLDRAFGGPEHIANLTLAHSHCNSAVANVQSLREKVERIIFLRQQESIKCQLTSQ